MNSECLRNEENTHQLSIALTANLKSAVHMLNGTVVEQYFVVT